MSSATILLDSLSEDSYRLTTAKLRYPRVMHAELLTHRALSRSSSSSRALPVRKVIEDVLTDPYIPKKFGKNQSGMQSVEYLEGEDHENAVASWLVARDRAVERAENLLKLKVHKQYANRVLEPFSYITVIVSATSWDNFFALRAHEAAFPDFQDLAYEMLRVYNESEPQLLKRGEWHIPFADKHCEGLSLEQKIKVGVARCARVSYNNFDGEISLEKDLDLHDKLVVSKPAHASPAEHVARAMNLEDWQTYGYSPHCRNYCGYVQYRATLSEDTVYRDPRVIRTKKNGTFS